MHSAAAEIATHRPKAVNDRLALGAPVHRDRPPHYLKLAADNPAVLFR